MDVREAQRELLNILAVAVQTGANVVHLFADEDRLFVVREGAREAPSVFVLDGAAAIFRALLSTMDDPRGAALEGGEPPAWCLDLTVAGGRAHFDMTQNNVVTVRIIAPPAARADDDVQIDERELAEALEGVDQAVAANAQVPPEKGPQEVARDLVSDILLARKPFPRAVIDALPPALTQRLEFVPIMFVGTALAVAVGDAGLTADAQAVLSRDVIPIQFDEGRFRELMVCYRTDPRHRR